MNKLIYQNVPTVTLSTNTFRNVPVILQYDETPLISIVREESLGYTTEIPIYHQDGTYLAKVNGTRIYPTEAGKLAGLSMKYPKGMTVCEMDGRTLFEIFHSSGDSFRTEAELFTPDGCFVKCHDSPIPELIKASGEKLAVGGIHMSGNIIANCRIGVWLRSDGSCTVGCS